MPTSTEEIIKAMSLDDMAKERRRYEQELKDLGGLMPTHSTLGSIRFTKGMIEFLNKEIATRL